MPPLSVLIKPASGSCDLRCRYCFYEDETQNRSTANYGMMREETLEQIIKKILAYADGSCTIGFQGGEPTLRGLDFFERLIRLEKRHNLKKVTINHAIQTNGMHLDERWAAFFKRNHFLVGLSMDGNPDVHDSLRVDAHGSGTHSRVMQAVELLNKYHVDFNILCVVTRLNASKVEDIYRFFMSNNLVYQQYIACLDPLGAPRGSQPYSLLPEDYGTFLTRLFDLWYEDRSAGKFVYNRYFENLAALMLGYPPEQCGMGRCAPQLVIEADGSVYPCDFYMLDDYRLGNLNTDSVHDIAEVWNRSAFAQESTKGLEQCRKCQWAMLCRGGCRRDRQETELHNISHNYFCPAYKKFFEHAVPKMAALLRKNARGGN